MESIASTKCTPCVSVVIIFFNSELYLGEAIESVRAQTFEDWELILVDDGSTDSSSAIARDYAAASNGRIRYIEHAGHANLGMSASRNAGVQAGRGDYIAHLDSDDVWMPRRLEVHVALLNAHPEVAMVYGPKIYWNSWTSDQAARGVDVSGLSADGDYLIDVGLPTNQPIEPPLVLTRYLESGGAIVPGICSLLVRRAVLLSNGGSENCFRALYEDQVFLAKVALENKILVIDEPLDYYRQHFGSACQQAIEARLYDPMIPDAPRKLYLDWLAEYMRAKQVEDARLWAALHEQLWPYHHPLLFRIKKLPLLTFWWVKRVMLMFMSQEMFYRLRNMVLSPTESGYVRRL